MPQTWSISWPFHCVSAQQQEPQCQAHLLQRESSKKYLYLFRICMGHINPANLFSLYSKTEACVNNPIEIPPLCHSYQICYCNRGQSLPLCYVLRSFCVMWIINRAISATLKRLPFAFYRSGAALRLDGSCTPLSYNSILPNNVGFWVSVLKTIKEYMLTEVLAIP